MSSYCIVLAGGVGVRMGAAVPKQFIEIGGVPIIIHTLRKMMCIADFRAIVIPIVRDGRDALVAMLRRYDIADNRIVLADGGEDRTGSILHGIEKCEELGAGDDDVVVVHDAVRPFVRKNVLLDGIKCAQKYGASVAVMPAVDTMLVVENGEVVDVPPRSRLYHGQAPDSAKIGLLKKAILSLTADERKRITGTAQICIAKGIKVMAIPGNVENIKLTAPEDLKRAEQLLAEGID